MVHMAGDERDEAEVVALRFDETTIAEDLARWCDGRLDEKAVPENPTDLTTIIWVPGVDGPVAARIGDWIVLLRDGHYAVYTHEAFNAKFEASD